MKRALALGVASLCVLGMAYGVLAEEMTGDTQDVPAEYDVSSAYTVTIPAAITFSAANTSVEDIIRAENVLIKDSETLKISMSSANGRLQNGNSSFINYSFALGEDEEVTIASGTEYDLLSVEAGEIEGAEKDIVFTAGDLENVNLAGMHSDTLTFRVEVDDGTISMQSIQDLKSSFVEGEQFVVKDSRDSKKYFAAKIGDDIWMTQNLDYVPDTSSEAIGIMAGDGDIYTTGVANFTGGSNAHFSQGAYYDWNAAKRACPEGWTLPTKTQLDSLISNQTQDTIMEAPFYGVRAGYINFSDETLYNEGIIGSYWTSSEQITSGKMVVTTARSLNLKDDNSLSDFQYKQIGASVRCVVSERIPNAVYMQDLNGEDDEKVAQIKQGIVDGTITSMFDKRDNNEYTVASLNNNIWMTRDLQYTNNMPWDSGVYAQPKYSASVIYDWNTASTQREDDKKNACPKGWTLPTPAQLSSISTSWDFFNNVFAGHAVGLGNVGGPAYFGGYWSSQETNTNTASMLFVDTSDVELRFEDYEKTTHLSVRCVAL